MIDPHATNETTTIALPGVGLRDRIVAALRDVYDPEVPVNIYDMGLIYDIDLFPAEGAADAAVADAAVGDVRVEIRMTLTSPTCPVAESLPGEVEDIVRAVAGVAACTVTLVWEPAWDLDKLTDEAKLEFGLY